MRRIRRWLRVLHVIVLLALGMPHLAVAAPLSTEQFPKVSTMQEVPAIELAYVLADELPAFLPYSLDFAVQVTEPAPLAANAVVSVTLPAGVMPEQALAQQLVRLFFYDEATGLWQKLATERIQAGDAWVLRAPAAGPGVYAAALATTNDYGDYAQPWQPTVSEAQVDLFTGAVQWSFPIDIPGGRGGIQPDLSLNYNSGIVDETRGEMNPQSPGVGLGWTMSAAYIEREIQRDARGTPQIFMDQRDKFRLVLNGVSSKLICVDSKTPCQEFHTEDERYWRIQRLGGAPNESRYTLVDGIQGEYWLVTTPDGTQYRFGWSGDKELYPEDNENQLSAWYMLGKETWGTPQEVVPYIWRWNLDQVSDAQGNLASFFYTREYNDTAICNDGATDPYSDCWYAVKDLGTTDLGWFYLFDESHWVDATPFYGGYGDHILSRKGYVRGGHLL